MGSRRVRIWAAPLALAILSSLGTAQAVPLLCHDTTVNHMFVDTSQVSSCLGSGMGNINGNPRTDDFLAGEGAGLGLIGIGSGSFTQMGSVGTFSLPSSLWDEWSNIAIGFKFGTGNRPDEWFVYLLNPSVSAGNWQFANVFNRGGGLSHVQLYGAPASTNVPEPGTLALLGIGILSAGFARRRKRSYVSLMVC